MSIYDKSSLVLIPSGTKTGKVFSQKPVSGDGDFTFTRASAATRVNADGNIEKETQNLLLQSNSFNTTWVNSSSTETSGQSGYDGSSDAWLLTATSTTNAYLAQTKLQSGVQSFSVYAKSGTANFIELIGIGGTNPRAWFNVSSGSVGTFDNGAIDANIESIGSGWYRCTLVLNDVIGQYRIYATDADASPSVTNGATIYIQDAQLNQGLIAQEVITTTTTALYGGITDNTPRLDYTDSSCPALLLEPQRTNIVPHSEYLEDLSSVNASLSANEAISPDGGNNATKLGAFVAAPSNQWARYFNIVQPNQKQALSIYAKAGNIDDFTITYYDQSTGDLFFNYDLGAGSVSAPTGNANYVDADIQDLGNGWYRCIAVANAQASGTNAQFQISAGVQRVVSNIGDYVYIYGYQWEQDATYATSYIPTYGSSVSRVADACSKTGVSSLIGQTEGTIFVEINFDSSTTNYEVGFAISDSVSASTKHAWIGRNNSNRLAAFLTNIGSQLSYTPSSGGIISTGNHKIALSYASNDAVVYIDGAQVASSSSVSVPTMNTAELGLFRGAVDQADSEVKQTLVFKERLTNAELATLTTI